MISFLKYAGIYFVSFAIKYVVAIFVLLFILSTFGVAKLTPDMANQIHWVALLAAIISNFGTYEQFKKEQADG